MSQVQAKVPESPMHGTPAIRGLPGGPCGASGIPGGSEEGASRGIEASHSREGDGE